MTCYGKIFRLLIFLHLLAASPSDICSNWIILKVLLMARVLDCFSCIYHHVLWWPTYQSILTWICKLLGNWNCLIYFIHSHHVAEFLSLKRCSVNIDWEICGGNHILIICILSLHTWLLFVFGNPVFKGKHDFVIYLSYLLLVLGLNKCPN